MNYNFFKIKNFYYASYIINYHIVKFKKMILSFKIDLI